MLTAAHCFGTSASPVDHMEAGPLWKHVACRYIDCIVSCPMLHPMVLVLIVLHCNEQRCLCFQVRKAPITADQIAKNGSSIFVLRSRVVPFPIAQHNYTPKDQTSLPSTLDPTVVGHQRPNHRTPRGLYFAERHLRRDVRGERATWGEHTKRSRNGTLEKPHTCSR